MVTEHKYFHDNNFYLFILTITENIHQVNDMVLSQEDTN